MSADSLLGTGSSKIIDEEPNVGGAEDLTSDTPDVPAAQIMATSSIEPKS